MKTKKPTLREVESVPCPTCGAAAGEQCELNTGQPRNEPHLSRRELTPLRASAQEVRGVPTFEQGAALRTPRRFGPEI